MATAGALLCCGAQAQEITLRTVSSFAEGIKDSQRFERMLKDINARGGTAITSPPSEVYTMMERGTVDGYGWPTAGIFDWSLEKVTKYRIEPSFYSTGLYTLVNLDVWKK